MLLEECANVDVAVLWGDSPEREELSRILNARGVRFVTCTPKPGDARELALPDGCRIIILDFDSLRPQANALLQRVGQLIPVPTVLVLTSSRDRQDSIDLLTHQVVSQLLAKNFEHDGHRLIVTLHKIIRRDYFSLEKYIKWGISPIEEVVQTSLDKDSIIDRFEAYLKSSGSNQRQVDLAKTVADEFILNAVYNAPVDDEGKPKYASRSRAEPVYLLPNEQALFRYASDGTTLALSIDDPFGRLEPSKIRSYLRRCWVKGMDQIEPKEGGAGLGLYYIFESVSHLVFNLSPGKRTEIIGLMDISLSNREFTERPKSLSIFVQEGAP